MFKNVFVAMITLLCSNAYAAICDGIVTSVAIQNEGSLLVRQAGQGHWFLCNVNERGTYGGGVVVDPATCRGWQAILMAAQKTGTSVRLYMRDPNHTCSLPDWSIASVYFVEDLG